MATTAETRRPFSPDQVRPGESITEELAEMQEDFGRVSAEATRALADGKITFLERSILTVRLRGLSGKIDDLLEVLG